MATRRAPLANVPNAVNSPFRAFASVSGKRTRAQTCEQREAIYGQPPAKKQAIPALQHDEENVDPRKRGGVSVSVQDKLDEPFGKRTTHAHPTAFERKLAAAREKKPAPSQRPEKAQKHYADNLESIRQWQKHYRRQFPQFVFYFDNIPDDVRSKATRQIHSLGARDSKFFDKNVTHVVTSRSIPADQTSTSPDDPKDEAHQPKTVQTTTASLEPRRSATLLEGTLQRRPQQHATSIRPSMEQRKGQAQATDILHRARAYGIKIWAQEKLCRVLNTILDMDAGDHTYDLRNHSNVQRVPTKQTQDVDLEQLLRHERVNGPADRDMTVATHDMVALRGCYIYVHDMDERTKPSLVRDYPRPLTKEQGKWPQFRLSGTGRCPFVEDPSHSRKLEQQGREARAKAQQDLVHRKTRAGSALLAVPLQAAGGHEMSLRRSPRRLESAGKPSLDPPALPPTRRLSSAEMPPLFGSAQASLRGRPRMVGGEPVASGVQPSNITSAIRSQAVSSAAISSTAPGFNRRVGDTKEVSLLKRKVFSNNSIPSSHVNDVRPAINAAQDPPPRAAKRKAQETLGVVLENETALARTRTSVPKRIKVAPKDPKPGYCENCRDKFDDFDDHIISRKHRKFALGAENWKELDDLLTRIKRVHKDKKQP